MMISATAFISIRRASTTRECCESEVRINSWLWLVHEGVQPIWDDQRSQSSWAQRNEASWRNGRVAPRLRSGSHSERASCWVVPTDWRTAKWRDKNDASYSGAYRFHHSSNRGTSE